MTALNDLLREEDLRSISVGAIARRAGLGRSTFYFYFPSKEVATAALLEDLLGGLLPLADSPGARSVAAEDAFRGAATEMATVWMANAHLFRAMHAARSTDPVVAAEWDRWISALTARNAAAIERRRAIGEALPGPDASSLSRVLVNMTLGALADAVEDTGPADIVTLVETLVTVWLRVIFGEARQAAVA